MTSRKQQQQATRKLLEGVLNGRPLKLTLLFSEADVMMEAIMAYAKQPDVTDADERAIISVMNKVIAEFERVFPTERKN